MLTASLMELRADVSALDASGRSGLDEARRLEHVQNGAPLLRLLLGTGTGKTQHARRSAHDDPSRVQMGTRLRCATNWLGKSGALASRGESAVCDELAGEVWRADSDSESESESESGAGCRLALRRLAAPRNVLRAQCDLRGQSSRWMARHVMGFNDAAARCACCGLDMEFGDPCRPW